MADIECPGCGLFLPATKSSISAAPFASAECLTVQIQVETYAAEHAEQLGHLSEMTLDAYRAQHSVGADAAATFLGLSGLWLVLDMNYTGREVASAHEAIATSTKEWPVFQQRVFGLPTIAAVARATTPLDHAMAVNTWAQAVWRSWRNDHDRVADEVRKLVDVTPR